MGGVSAEDGNIGFEDFLEIAVRLGVRVKGLGCRFEGSGVRGLGFKV